MQYRERILLEWLSKIVDIPIFNVSELSDGFTLIKLMNKSRDFGTVIDNEIEGWKGNYLRMKNIFKEIQLFYKQVIKAPFPQSVITLNLVQIAKGQDKEGLLTILILIFIACIQAQQKQAFISVILQFDEEKQKQLMDVIQQYKINKNEVSIQTEEQKDKQRINQLCFYLQNLQVENESLNHNLMQQVQKYKNIQENNKRLQEQNKKLKRQLNQKNALLRQSQQIIDSKANKMLADTNNDIIQDLKKSFFIEAEQYNRQIQSLKERINQLQQKLQDSYRQNTEIQSQIYCQSSKMVVADHSNCISLNKHKQSLFDMANKMKQYSKNEVNYKMQILKLKNQTEILKKQKEKLQNKKNENNMYIDRNSAKNIKIEILQQIKTSLQQKLEDIKNKNESSTSSKFYEIKESLAVKRRSSNCNQLRKMLAPLKNVENILPQTYLQEEILLEQSVIKTQ